MEPRRRHGVIAQEQAGCSTPEKPGTQQGKVQASPFSAFAADLSPITPSRTFAFDNGWQPPIVSPQYGAAGLGGPYPFATEFGGQSGDKSSLRSSYETEVAALDTFFASPTEPRPSGNQVPAAKLPGPPTSGPSSQPAHGQKENHAGALSPRADQGPDALGGPSTRCAPGLSIDPPTTTADQDGLLASPFAALASEQPPKEWADEAPPSSKSDEQRRQRKRVLRFPSPTRDSQEPATGSPGLPLQATQPSIQPPTASSQAAASETASPVVLPDPSSLVSAPPAPRLGLSAAVPLHGMPVLPGNPSSALRQPASAPFPGGLPAGEMTSALAAALAAAPSSAPGMGPIGDGASSMLPGSLRRQPPPPGPGVTNAPKRQMNKRAEREAAAAAGQKRCNCKKSRCLKLYCDCFAAGQYCTNCTCTECRNTMEHRDAVMEMRETIQARNSSAFDTKVIQKVETSDGVVSQHKRGCHCKKSNCKKKYCECFQAGVNCGQHCKCENCHNQSEHGLPEPKKGSGARGSARADTTKHSAGKDGGEVEPKRSSARPRKRPSSAAGLDSSEPLLLDAWAQPSSGPPLARSKITSPPSLVWESQPLYQATGTLLEDRGLSPLSLPKDGSLAAIGGRGPPARTLSALPDLSAPPPAKGRPLRTGSGSFLGGGSAAVAGLLRGQDAYLPLPFSAAIEPIEEEVLAAAGVDVGRDAGLVPDGAEMPPAQPARLHFGAADEYEGRDDGFGSQGAFYGRADQFAGMQHEGMDAAAPMSAATRWTEDRLDDLETAGDMPFNLGEILEEPGAELDNAHFLLPPELGRSSPGHDENAAPFDVDGLAMASDTGQGKLGGRMMGSPGRDPFGPPPTSGEDSAGRHDSALRTHRPSAPALPSPTLKRARSGEVLGPDLEAFQDGFLREAMLGGEGELSLDILGGVQLADLCGPPRKRRPGSPLGFPPLSPLGAANAQGTRGGAGSPLKSRIVLPSGPGSSFLRLGAGSTIFSPSKGT